MHKICFALMLLAACQSGAADRAQLPDSSLATVSGGKKALDAQVQACLHNIANVNTYGYKLRRVVLSELAPPRTDRDGRGVHTGLDIGRGVMVSTVITDMRPGALEATGRKLDIAVTGRGFFQVRMHNGAKAYTRNGSFTIDCQSRMVTQSGYLVLPEITFPQDVIQIGFNPNGSICITTATSPNSRTPLGQLQLARFMHPEALRPVGSGLFKATETGSGMPIVGNPGDRSSDIGNLLQAHLESSNVNIEEEAWQLTRLRRQLGMFEALFAPEISSGKILSASFRR